ncbi:MAG: GNAT family N-acetyltransferase [Gaiellales bacterium]
MPILAPDPPLADGRVRLRPAAARDADALARACADPDLAAWVDPPAAGPAPAAAGLLAQLTGGWDSGRTASFVHVRPETGDVLALIAVMIDDDPEVAEVAYWVAPAARGRGIATAALGLVSRWSLRELGLERLWLEIEPGNAASHRVAERSGFRREGVLRAHCRDRRSGLRHDCVVYSLLPGDLP